MSDADSTPPQGGPQQQLPPLVVNIQYVKDLSFEVPGAPMIYTQLHNPPRVDINLDVQVRRVTEGSQTFEVTLSIRADATEAPADATGQAATSNAVHGPRVFLAELAYAGVFTLNGIQEQAVEPTLLVECPRLLFPFARNLLADITREGGFAPVFLQPIDFVALWQQRRQQAAAAGAASVAGNA